MVSLIEAIVFLSVGTLKGILTSVFSHLIFRVAPVLLRSSIEIVKDSQVVSVV